MKQFVGGENQPQEDPCSDADNHQPELVPKGLAWQVFVLKIGVVQSLVSR